MMTIYPYLLSDNLWVFDDPETRLKEEAFVSGMSEMISALVVSKGIPDAKRGFSLSFNDEPFEHDVELRWLKTGIEGVVVDSLEARTAGNWYSGEVAGTEMEGWFCPALFRYFDRTPMKFFVRADSLPVGVDPIWHDLSAGEDQTEIRGQDVLGEFQDPSVIEAGWQSDLPTFHHTNPRVIQDSLENFIRDFSAEQAAAWKEAIPLLQKEAGEILDRSDSARDYGTLWEYKLPYDGRRPDVLVLANGAIVVLELKGKATPSQADLDQAAAYARDLRAYHRACHERTVTPIVVPTKATDVLSESSGVLVVAPNRIDEIVLRLASQSNETGPSLSEFLADDAYCPLPTLVEAARELFHSRTIREIWRARAATQPAVDTITAIAKAAARTRSRHLVLVTGVPGAGKTLVGMQVVHSTFLDEIAVERESGAPTVPGLYLTGNGSLAEVLQYELRKAGGGGRVFVRHIKEYLTRYVPRPDRIPPEHLLVFDEAQRAYSADKVADQHDGWSSNLIASEPELFVQLCDRMPEWSVLVGLIGSGQEIFLGEEEGLSQWVDAIDASPNKWTVHAPASVESVFSGSDCSSHWQPSLNLNTELRFHCARRLHDFVAEFLRPNGVEQASRLVESLWAPDGVETDGMRLYATRDLDLAKCYLRERYADSPNARFGMIASSRDKDLIRFGVPNDFMATKRVKKGPWFTEGEEDPRSCRHLIDAVTEFGCQGLELEMPIVAWGTDLIRENGDWTIRKAAGFRPNKKKRTRPVDPFRMRINTYRVLLTRGRDGVVVFIPELAELDETWGHFLASGFRELSIGALLVPIT